MKKATRKALSMVLIMITMLTLFGQSAFAIAVDQPENISQDILDEIKKADDYVYDAIAKTQKKAEKEALKNNNSKEYEEYLDDLIDKLHEKTEEKVDKVIEKAADEGVKLEKNYFEVIIGGRTVLVDPFYAH